MLIKKLYIYQILFILLPVVLTGNCIFAQSHAQNIEINTTNKSLIQLVNTIDTLPFYEAIQISKKLTQRAFLNGDFSELALIHEKEGNLYFKQGYYFLAIDCFFKAMILNEKLQKNIPFADNLISIAKSYSAVKLYDLSLLYFQKSLKIYENENSKEGIALTYSFIAESFMNLKRHKEASDYINKSLIIANELTDKLLRAQIYLQYSEILTLQDKYLQAFSYIDKAIVLTSENDDYELLADLYFQKSEIYFLQKKFSLARENYLNALTYFKKINKTSDISRIEIKIGITLLSEKKEYEALKYAYNALKLVSGTKNFSIERDANLLLANIFMQNDKADIALSHYIEYSNFKDSIYNNDIKNRNNELFLSIEEKSNKKENQILKQQAYVKEVVLQKQRNTIIFTIIVIILLIIVLFLGYGSYKNRANVEMRLKQFSFVTNEGIIIHTKGIINEINERLCKLTGYTREQLIGKSIYEILPPDYHEQLRLNLESRQPYYADIKLIRSNSTELFAKLASETYYYRSKPMSIIALRDLTDQRNAQIKLHESELKFKTLVDSSPDGVVILNAKSSITYASKTFIELFCFQSVENLNTVKFIDLIAESDKRRFAADLLNTFRGIPIGASEYEAKNTKDQSVYIECNGQYLKLSDKNSQSVFYIIRDITDRKLLEKALTESELRFRMLFEKANDAIILENEIGHIIDANPFACNLFNYSYHELLLLTTKDLGLINFYQIDDSVTLIKSQEATAKGKNNLEMEVHVSLSKIEQTKSSFYLYIIRDISEQKNTEKSLRKYAEDLKESNFTKDTMFSIIAHDLRGPIGNYKSMLELITDRENNFTADEMYEMLNLMKDSSANTLELLENLLFWAKNQRGDLHFEPQFIRFSSIVYETLSIYKPNAKAKNIELIYENKCDCEVKVDLNMMRTVMRNLISNAIKFSYSGAQVFITQSQEDNKIKLVVKDFGTGISEENLKKLFKPNMYFSTVGTKNEKGSGLGLILCKEFIEKNKGEFGVVSIYGKGTEFFFVIEIV